MNMFIIWAIAIVVFGVLEAVTAQLVSIWFVIGAIGSLIATALGANLAVQLIIFTAVSIVALVLTRPLVKKYIKPKMQSTNADRCIGEDAVVTERIDNILATGQAKVLGNTWSARTLDGETVEVGEIVKVVKIEGVKLIVARK